MNKIVLAIASVAALTATQALATPSAFNWSGFYAGGNFGGGWGHSDASGTFAVTGSGSTTVVPFDAGVTEKGVLGGGQIGFNYEFSNRLVLGVEADIDLADISGSTNICPLGPADECVTHANRLDYFGTLRGRLGYAFDNVLVYGTGGFAWGRGSASSTVTCVSAPTFGAPLECPASSTAFDLPPSSATSTFGGWAAGGGVEWGLWRNWSLRAEYLHLQFNDVASELATSGTVYVPIIFGNVAFAQATQVRTNTGIEVVRVALNYHFH